MDDFKTPEARAQVYRLSEFHRRARSTDVADGRTVTVRMTMTAGGGARLFNYLAEESECILISPDGRVSIKVQLAFETAQITEERFADGSLVIDWLACTLSHGRRRTTLSRTELRLVAALLEGQGKPVPRARLIARGWPGREMNCSDKANDLAVYICTLRKQLTRIGLADVLRTVRGTGYVLAIDEIAPLQSGQENGSVQRRRRKSSRR